MLDQILIRTLTVDYATLVHPLSKLCQMNIVHLTSKLELPQYCKSTNEVLSVITNINENQTPLPETACPVYMLFKCIPMWTQWRF